MDGIFDEHFADYTSGKDLNLKDQLEIESLKYLISGIENHQDQGIVSSYTMSEVIPRDMKFLLFSYLHEVCYGFDSHLSATIREFLINLFKRLPVSPWDISTFTNNFSISNQKFELEEIIDSLFSN